MTNYLSETWEWYQLSCKDGAPVISICMEVSAAHQGSIFLWETLNQRLKLICSTNWKAHLGLKGLQTVQYLEENLDQ